MSMRECPCFSLKSTAKTAPVCCLALGSVSKLNYWPESSCTALPSPHPSGRAKAAEGESLETYFWLGALLDWHFRFTLQKLICLLFEQLRVVRF